MDLTTQIGEVVLDGEQLDTTFLEIEGIQDFQLRALEQLFVFASVTRLYAPQPIYLIANTIDSIEI